MSGLFDDGRLVDIVLALVALEAAALVALRLWRRRGPALTSIVCTMLAGSFLLLALRAALDHAAPQAIALAVLCAGVAHACDLALRWSPAAGPSPANRSMPATISLKIRAPKGPNARETSASEVSDV